MGLHTQSHEKQEVNEICAEGIVDLKVKVKETVEDVGNDMSVDELETDDNDEVPTYSYEKHLAQSEDQNNESSVVEEDIHDISVDELEVYDSEDKRDDFADNSAQSEDQNKTDDSDDQSESQGASTDAGDICVEDIGDIKVKEKETV